MIKIPFSKPDIVDSDIKRGQYPIVNWESKRAQVTDLRKLKLYSIIPTRSLNKQPNGSVTEPF